LLLLYFIFPNYKINRSFIFYEQIGFLSLDINTHLWIWILGISPHFSSCRKFIPVTKEEVLATLQVFVSLDLRLWTRKEKEIAIVKHSEILFYTLTAFGNDCHPLVKKEISDLVICDSFLLLCEAWVVVSYVAALSFIQCFTFFNLGSSSCNC